MFLPICQFLFLLKYFLFPHSRDCGRMKNKTTKNDRNCRKGNAAAQKLMEAMMDNSKVFAMKFSKIYPLLVQKAERKNRTKQEVDQIICWLTGYDENGLLHQLQQDVDYQTFFEQAPCMNPNRSLIKGVVCGVRVETIEDSLMRDIRYLDKLIDELAKGKAMEKILRA